MSVKTTKSNLILLIIAFIIACILSDAAHADELCEDVGFNVQVIGEGSVPTRKQAYVTAVKNCETKLRLHTFPGTCRAKCQASNKQTGSKRCTGLFASGSTLCSPPHAFYGDMTFLRPSAMRNGSALPYEPKWLALSLGYADVHCDCFAVSSPEKKSARARYIWNQQDNSRTSY
ncbi:MAG: hypothetical protein KDD66_01120 [Bdellovibrionales bacterium]|nr:hypothetical protein [Bdellovibrionales bacterium]